MKKRIALILVVVLLLSVLTGCGAKEAAPVAEKADAQPAAQTEPAATEPEAEPVLIRLGTSVSETNTAAVGLEVFKTEVEEKSGGRITVEIYYNGQLAEATQNLPSIVKGNFEMTTSGPTYVVEYMPGYEFLSMGYLFRDYTHAEAVLSGDVGQEIFDLTAEMTGLRPLDAFYLGARHVALAEDKEVDDPSDLKGLKLRTNGSEAYNTLVTAMGGNPVGIALGEMYTAVQTGTVDGYECPIATILSQSFDEVTGSISYTNHLVDMTWLAIGDEFFQSLSAEDQQIIMDAAHTCCDVNTQATLDAEAAGEEELTAAGVKLYKIDTSVMQATVLEHYKNNQTGWDLELLDKIQNVGK